MHLTPVSIVEGGPGGAHGGVGSFELHVERSGWNLVDLATGVETHWSWDDISALTATEGVETPDGAPGTVLEVIVNGWPVRLLALSAQLPPPGATLLTMLAPARHVVRATGPATGVVRSRWRDELLWSRRTTGIRSLPVRAVGRAGIGAAVGVAVMVAATVVGAAVLASGSTAAPSQHGAVHRGEDSSSATVPATAPPGRVPAVPSLGPSTAVAGTIAGVGTLPVPAPAAISPSRRARSTSPGRSSAKPSKSGASVAPTSDVSSTSGPPGTTQPVSTTTIPASTTTVSSTTTTTRPRRRPRPPTTTTAPPATTTPAS